MEMIERYLNLTITPLRPNLLDVLLFSVRNKFSNNTDYYILVTGIKYLVFVLRNLFENQGLFQSAASSPYLKSLTAVIDDFRRLSAIKNAVNKKPEEIDLRNIALLDEIFRKKKKESTKNLIDLVYQLDAFQSIAKVAQKSRWSLPEYSTSTSPLIEIEALHHPIIESAVANDVFINNNKNIFFLTGPNMAGKSTFLKSLGICMYLAHIGFPVPAEKMKTSIFKGLITTINLSDNINLGHSHFYGEVKRVKETVLKILKNENVLVIFDELFRGTNVKDAFEGSLSTITALTKVPKSVFFISTHIIEVAEALAPEKSIQFKCLESSLNKNKVAYNYRLKEGVSTERVGLTIIKNEQILELLEQVAKQQVNPV